MAEVTSVRIAYAPKRELHGLHLGLHGYGGNTRGLAGYADGLASADSMAWRYGARWRPQLPGCFGRRNCANCPRYALAWRARLVSALDRPQQLRLGGVA
jgi:hypothetical protein